MGGCFICDLNFVPLFVPLQILLLRVPIQLSAGCGPNVALASRRMGLVPLVEDLSI